MFDDALPLELDEESSELFSAPFVRALPDDGILPALVESSGGLLSAAVAGNIRDGELLLAMSLSLRFDDDVVIIRDGELEALTAASASLDSRSTMSMPPAIAPVQFQP